MFKRWRSYVALLLCLCCTFATLSLNTLQVRAASNSYNITYTTTLYPNGTDAIVSGTISPNSGGSGYLNNGSGTITGISGGGGSITSNVRDFYDYHVRVPVTLVMNKADVGSNIQADTWLTYFIYGISLTTSGGTVSNLVLYDMDGNLAYNPSASGVDGSGIVSFCTVGDVGSAYGSKLYFNYFVEYDVSYQKWYDAYDATFTSSCNLSLNLQCRTSYDSEINHAKEQVVDSDANAKLNQQIQQENTAQQTRTGILSQLTSFFGSFFENIINSLKSLFIPEDGYFTNWFTRLNTLLSAKLGMLYAPFDLVISVLTALGNASTSEAGIPFPELSWDGHVIIPAQTFYFSSLGSSFSDLRDAVYFGTDVVLLFAFLVLLQRKINLVMRGNEEG